MHEIERHPLLFDRTHGSDGETAGSSDALHTRFQTTHSDTARQQGPAHEVRPGQLRLAGAVEGLGEQQRRRRRAPPSPPHVVQSARAHLGCQPRGRGRLRRAPARQRQVLWRASAGGRQFTG
jgi:hypothetical protein